MPPHHLCSFKTEPTTTFSSEQLKQPPEILKTQLFVVIPYWDHEEAPEINQNQNN